MPQTNANTWSPQNPWIPPHIPVDQLTSALVGDVFHAAQSALQRTANLALGWVGKVMSFSSKVKRAYPATKGRREHSG